MPPPLPVGRLAENVSARVRTRSFSTVAGPAARRLASDSPCSRPTPPPCPERVASLPASRRKHVPAFLLPSCGCLGNGQGIYGTRFFNHRKLARPPASRWGRLREFPVGSIRLPPPSAPTTPPLPYPPPPAVAETQFDYATVGVLRSRALARSFLESQCGVSELNAGLGETALALTRISLALVPLTRAGNFSEEW